MPLFFAYIFCFFCDAPSLPRLGRPTGLGSLPALAKAVIQIKMLSGAELGVDQDSGGVLDGRLLSLPNEM
jgi:hypothetical protein